MPVSTRGNTTILTCKECRSAQMTIEKKDVSDLEWKDNSGWKALRTRAYAANWRISASTNGDHYCPKCIALYDF